MTPANVFILDLTRAARNLPLKLPLAYSFGDSKLAYSLLLPALATADRVAEAASHLSILVCAVTSAIQLIFEALYPIFYDDAVAEIV